MSDGARVSTLEWGVKQSFRGYVEAAGGTIEAGGGAAKSADGGFAFAASAEPGLHLDPAGRPQGQATFPGELTFKAHGGMLSVFIADPAIEITDGGAVLTVADHPSRDRRVEFARLDLDAAARDESGALVIPAALAMWGCQILGDHYPARTPLDPVRLITG